MEIKFNQTLCRHLRRAVDQIQTQEQTQEVRLPDTMPDIGRVLGAWGKPLIRSKEWRNGGMNVTGGVMAWVLYTPEDGSEPRSYETWIPFQLKWEFPETQRDGFIYTQPLLRAIDARSTSARKMMVRANISALGRGLESVETEIYSPQEVPEDVQLRTAVYPMELPCECGEKLFQTDDELDAPPMEKVLRYDVRPVIQEQRVMASRLVFRGKSLVHILYLSDGKVCAWEGEVPFSQFADLDGEYGSNATAQITPLLTNMELDMVENRLQLKTSLAVQYLIYDRCMVELVEDAYSPRRSVELQQQELQLPMRLDLRTELLQPEQTIHGDAETIVDVCMHSDHPQRQQNGDSVGLSVPGAFQMLYYDPAGNLQSGTARFEMNTGLEADANALVDGSVVDMEKPQAILSGDGVGLSGAIQLAVSTFAQRGQPMVTGLELGELRESDPQRPSLILRRYDGLSLWDMAKECGSTVEEICRANGGEPEPGKMVLIPVS